MMGFRFAIVLLAVLLVIPAVLFRPAGEGSVARVASGIVTESAVAALEDAAAPAYRGTRGPGTRHRTDRSRSAKAETKQQRQQWEDRCIAAGLLWLPRSDICTHGPDPAPRGVTMARRSPPVPPAVARVAAEAVTCDGDGRSGARVQILYVRAANVPNHYAPYLESFRAWAADMDAVMRESAAVAGGGLRIRFVTTANCDIDVAPVVLSPAGDDSFDRVIAQLQARGFNRPDRKYVAFIDTIFQREVCGVGGMQPDDRPGQNNLNNGGPSYSLVFAHCWDELHTPAHELMHNLGAVQLSAPHTSQGGHCIDERDIMCYSDEPRYPEMRVLCDDQALEYRFDCGNDDYFDPSPPYNAYLATHWNTANSRFLVATGANIPDTEPPTVTWLAPVENDEEYTVTDGSVALEVSARDDRGISRVEFWRYDEVWERAIRIAVDTAAPYTASVSAADLQPEWNDVWAETYDTAANYGEAEIFLYKEGGDILPEPEPETPPTFLSVAVTSPKAKATLKSGTTVPIGIGVTNGGATTRVEARYCTGTTCVWPAAKPIGSDASAPYSVKWRAPGAGVYTLLARADDPDQTLSEPVTVTVKKAKPNKKRRR